MFTKVQVEDKLFAGKINSEERGKAVSLKDAFPQIYASKIFVKDAKVHDANFAFLSTKLAKMHETPAEPIAFATYGKDIDIDYGGGFVDYVQMYEVDYKGLMDEFNNLFGNNGNVLPRVNAGMTKKTVPVYTFEVAYDLSFVELEKLTTVDMRKALEDIYKNAISVGFDFFANKVVYEGIAGSKGLFNSDKVLVSMIDNSDASTTHQGFKGMTDEAVVSWFNGMFATYLEAGGMNPAILPNRILVPVFVGKDLTGRMSALYTSTLRKFLLEHNLAIDEAEDESFKVSIVSRDLLNNAGTNGVGRIVAYRKDKRFVRIDMPYKLQHYITLPNIDRMAYTSAFVAQISAVQLMYNSSNTEQGIVGYWDFTK